ASAWFRSLTKPAIFPPTWLFGIFWTVLFLLMGVAAGLIWLSDHNGRRTALALFLVQMAFNVAWTPVFFLLQNMVLGLLVIIVLWVAVVATIWRFHRIDRRAAGLLVPYLLWISFAVVLNYRFIAIN
ncbi:MAG: TspO/MBR family protein, partial [Candidatus Nanohaloarchaea archaeon]|nr:TspO/MBR family protein [Candidatus Nanohaloarchaea archaeon]